MNASYEWLRAFVPFDETPSQLRDLITSRAATVDELVPLRADLANIVVARVVEEGPHPDSDHLHVTRVDAGTGELLDVVCGAPNVQAGKLYPFAMTGTIMPNGMKIERRKIRGAVSNGMLCSARELGLGEDHEGILELTFDAAPGTPLLRAWPLGDTRLVVDVLPNRPDLLSHLGLAREIAAAVGKPLSLPWLEGVGAAVPIAKRFRNAGNAGGIAVHVEEEGLVNRFMGVVVRGVNVGPSPRWLGERLEAVGSRSINNIVDASNYVLHELGQPTHAFDLATLDQHTIVVRRARAAERIVTLDGVERSLSADTIVIADASKPQAIAGVMGGRASEVTDGTTDVFLEVANFNAPRIRAARRKLGLSTDASYRFERGVDIDLAPRALERLVSIILAVAGGRIDGTPVDISRGEEPLPPIPVRTARVAKLLGDAVPVDEASALLAAVGFDATIETSAQGSGTVVRVHPPSWRKDVTAEIDVIEEIARLRGYDSFSEEIRPFRAGNAPDAPLWLTSRRVREALVGAGLLEVRPMPFVKGAEESHRRLANPLAENEAYLRRDLLDTLGRRAEFNLAHMQGNVRIFEIGDIFLPQAGQLLPREELHVALLVMGDRRPAHFTEPKPPAFDEWDAKALAELVTARGYPGASVVLAPLGGGGDVLWNIVVDGEPLGAVRRVPLDAPAWAAAAFGVELSLGVVSSDPAAARGAHAYEAAAVVDINTLASERYRPLPSTPPAEFDLALVVPDRLQAADVEAVIRGAAGELLEQLRLFDMYRGEGVAAGHRSLAWRLTLRHPERTLRDKEIEGRRAKILSALQQELDVRPRTF